MTSTGGTGITAVFYGGPTSTVVVKLNEFYLTNTAYVLPMDGSATVTSGITYYSYFQLTLQKSGGAAGSVTGTVKSYIMGKGV